MTAGLPGAGIGGLFYLASTFMLPVRSLVRRVRGRPDAVTSRQLGHSVGIALGVVGAIWLTGWLVGGVMPDELQTRTAISGPGAVPATAIPLATFVTGIGTLVAVLLCVEGAHRWSARRAGARRRGKRS